MKQIQLSKRSKKYVESPIFALVDDEDFDDLNSYSWHIKKDYSTGALYANRCIRDNSGTKVNIPMHRHIMNFPADMIVDHRDHNGLNNQKSNLRICTITQNIRNSKSRKNSTSKYLGVSLNVKKKVTLSKDGSPIRLYTCSRWIAQIETNGKNYNLGRYKKEEEAALAYNNKALELFGEFANLNII